MSQTVEQPGRLLPTLPGKVRGIVGINGIGSRKVYSIQCERCFTVEAVVILSQMGIHFHSRSPKDQNPRLCRPCRVDAYPDCICDSCRDDRRDK